MLVGPVVGLALGIHEGKAVDRILGVVVGQVVGLALGIHDDKPPG